ncbi:hypothetical protein LBSG162_20870 [Lentilactobacillus buchneri subsp. silagei]|nr:hypothetical protein Ltb232_17070 [Lentilactobacillus buchneri subsp. silagei]GED92982.1 hypothetical protein LBSG162_20870 [Lentilactobacillus buchneri subsp. silagei]GED95298.1 hypothetical protein LBSP_18580 [Lentilactobacillus buchneri subsp. silagei]GEP14267.1 hypothetical protein LBU01_14120 [Lentilactobacillus buchneri]
MVAIFIKYYWCIGLVEDSIKELEAIDLVPTVHNCHFNHLYFGCELSYLGADIIRVRGTPTSLTDDDRFGTH